MVNVAVAAFVLASGLWVPELIMMSIMMSCGVALALTVPLALARRQGAGHHDARLTVVQWTLFGATWAGLVLMSGASATAWAARVAVPISVDLSTPPRDDGWTEPLAALSTTSAAIAGVAWLALVVDLSTRLRGRRSGRDRPAADVRVPWHHRWANLVFALMVPVNLAMSVWVVSSPLFGDTGDLGQVVGAMTMVPVLIGLLFVSTIQAVRAVPWERGPLLAPAQAWLHVVLWASLGAVGAGWTVTTDLGPGSPSGPAASSAFLTLFPGAVDASQALVWGGVTGSVAAYTLLLVSLRKRRLASSRERRATIRAGRWSGARTS